MKRIYVSLAAFLSLALILLTGSGCESPSRSTTSPTPAPLESQMNAPVAATENPPLHPDEKLQGIWLDPEFYFSGYTALYVEPTQYAAEIRENESKSRSAALQAVQQAILKASLGSAVFPTVVSGSPPGMGKELRLSNTIVKFEPGSGLLKVRGQVYDRNKLVAVIEAERSGTNSVADIAGALADFFKRNSER